MRPTGVEPATFGLKGQLPYRGNRPCSLAVGLNSVRFVAET